MIEIMPLYTKNIKEKGALPTPAHKINGMLILQQATPVQTELTTKRDTL
jgi:hypothetical protein